MKHRSVGAHAVTVVFAGLLVASGCSLQPGDSAEPQFAAKSFCPSDRVRSTEESSLAVIPAAGSVSKATPWVEPAPPAGVAEDPGRQRLWKEKRDAEYNVWRAANAEADPTTSQQFAAARRRPVVAVRGCGATELYVCEQRQGRSVGWSCGAVVESWRADVTSVDRLICRNGGALHATGAGEATRFACAPPESPPALDPVGAAQTCLASCKDPDNAFACSSECGSSSMTDPGCRFRCGAEIGRCREACTQTAHDELEAAGLCGVGLCDSLATSAEKARAVGAESAKLLAQADQGVAAGDKLRALMATHQQCTDACRAPAERCRSSATSSVGASTCAQTLVGCALDCVRTAQASCESVAPPNSSWCDGFRSAEASLVENQKRAAAH